MFKRISIILLILLTLLAFTTGADATLHAVKDAGGTYIDYQDELGNSIMKIDDDDGVTVVGGFSAGGDFTVTDPTTTDNAVYGLVNAGVPWTTSTNVVGIRGKVVVTAAGTTGSATGVWAGIEITSASVQRGGLQVGLNVEAYSNTICLPNAVLYIQSLPSGTDADFSAVPYLVFSETVTNGAGSHILFEVGHMWANTIPDIGEDELFYNDTLQIAVNENAGTRTPFFIPLSTDSGTFTFEYPILTSYAGTAFTIATCTTGISITNATTYAIQIITDGKVIMGTGPDDGEVGIPVATSEHVLAVYSEVGALHTNATSSFGIRSRYLINYDQTNTVTFEAVDARLRVKQDLAGGVHCGVQGTIEASGSPAFAGGINAAGSFTLDLDTGTTITGSTYMMGVHIDSASHAAITVDGTTYVALRISAGDGPPVKEDWEYGIWMDDGDVGVGIQIGDCTNGIILDGTITTGLYIATGATNAITTGASGATGGDVKFWGGLANSFALWDASEDRFVVQNTFESNSEVSTYEYGMYVGMVFNTAAVTGKYISGIKIAMEGTGDYDSGADVWPLWIDIQNSGTSNTAEFDMIRLSVQSGAAIPDNYISFQTASPGVEYLFELVGDVAPYHEQGATYTTADGYIKIMTPDGAREIPVYTGHD